MDLRGCLDEILQVRAGEEVAKIDELAVVLILDYEMLAIGSQRRVKGVYIPLTTPQRFCRPRTCLPATTIVFSEPTTAKGIMLWVALVVVSYIVCTQFSP
jgi:hypothetical protein